MSWISVEDSLPEKDEWVQVYEDDEDNPQDSFIGRMLDKMYNTDTHFRQRVSPAKLLYIDSEGYADWYLCYVGGGPVKPYRNVTHWKPLSEKPEK